MVISPKKDYYTEIDTLQMTKEQFLLSIKVRAVYNGAGNLDCKLSAAALGPWSVGEKELKEFDHVRASWSLERISTQNLAVSLDSLIQKNKDRFKGWEKTELEDYFEYVRCLRNSFAHNPFIPKWELKDEKYRRKYKFFDFEFDLTDKHGVLVKPEQYLYAGGLIRLVDIGLDLMTKIEGD